MTSATAYLYVLLHEVIVAAVYLFNTYWIGMRTSCTPIANSPAQPIFSSPNSPCTPLTCSMTIDSDPVH